MADTKNIVRVKGNRIDLCALRTDDEAVELYTKWMNDSSILMWIGRNDISVTIDDEREWTKKTSQDNPRFNIVEKETGRLIGNCDIHRVGYSRNAVIGICIGEKEGRDKGYGTEAVKLMLRFAFKEMNVHRVKLTANGDNIRAINCYTKCGFKEVGREHETQWYNGKWCDTVIMEIMEYDYYNRKGNKDGEKTTKV